MVKVAICLAAIFAAVHCGVPRPASFESVHVADSQTLYDLSRNVVQVPDNCPAGQQLVNGQCRDIWRLKNVVSVVNELSGDAVPDTDTKNVVQVPDNCAAGQQLINGQCRDIWRLNYDVITSDVSDLRDNTAEAEIKNVVQVPDNCAAGQQLVNGQCRDIWTKNNVVMVVNEINEEEPLALETKNVVQVPDNCAVGQQLVNGQCRDIWRQNNVVSVVQELAEESTSDLDSKNVVQVPDNCAVGQQLVNGQCRDVWKNSNVLSVVNKLGKVLGQSVLQDDSSSSDAMTVGAEGTIIKTVITVPDQCPSGYKADANGNCRPIW